MTLEDYLANGFMVDAHTVEQNGLNVICLNPRCGFDEYLPTWEDAEVAKEIHESSVS